MTQVVQKGAKIERFWSLLAHTTGVGGGQILCHIWNDCYKFVTVVTEKWGRILNRFLKTNHFGEIVLHFLGSFPISEGKIRENCSKCGRFFKMGKISEKWGRFTEKWGSSKIIPYIMPHANILSIFHVDFIFSMNFHWIFEKST